MSTKDLINIVLDGHLSDTARTNALVELREHKDKANEAKWLIESFKTEKEDRQKSWMISILAGIHDNDVLDFVYDTILEGRVNMWIRFWAIVELERTDAPRIIESLREIVQTRDRPIKNLVKRILIGRGEKNGYLKEMHDDLKHRNYKNNLYVLRGLQFDLGKPLPLEIEEILFEPIKKILGNSNAVMDTRNMAAKVLGNFTHRKLEAIDALCEAYEGRVNSYVRRSIIDSVIRLNDKCTIPMLITALGDRDAEIRDRAARGLVTVTGDSSEAIRVIVNKLLEMDALNYDLVDAIRLISITKSTEVIKSCIIENDPGNKEKCLELLSYVGGIEAVKTIQEMRAAAVNDYTDILDKTDKGIMTQFNNLMTKAHDAFDLKMMMHKIVFSLGVLVLFIGIYTAFQEGAQGIQLYMGLFAVGGGGATIITVFYKGPLEKIKENLTNLLEITILFLGYVRQLNQIDASFKQVFLEDGFTLNSMKETVLQLQDTIEKTMAEVKASK